MLAVSKTAPLTTVTFIKLFFQMQHCLKLLSNYEMPILGLGTWKVRCFVKSFSFLSSFNLLMPL